MAEKKTKVEFRKNNLAKKETTHSLTSQPTIDYIFEKLSSGKTINKICQEIGLTQRIFFAWLKQNPEIQEAYLTALEVKCDVLAEQIIDIADDVEPNVNEIRKAELQINARKWYASKLSPLKYGFNQGKSADSVEQIVDVNVPQRLSREEWLKRVGDQNGD